METVLRPELSSISPSAGMISPGIIAHPSLHEQNDAEGSCRASNEPNRQFAPKKVGERNAASVQRGSRCYETKSIQEPIPTRCLSTVGMAMEHPHYCDDCCANPEVKRRCNRQTEHNHRCRNHGLHCG